MAAWPLYAVVAVVCVCCYDLLQQFWSRPVANKEPLARAVRQMVTSNVVSTGGLIGYRLAVAVICSAVLWFQSMEYYFGKLIMYFTIWNFILLSVYFALSALVTWCDWAFNQKGRKSEVLARFCRFLIVSFHIITTTVWIVDVVTWTVLWPTLKNILKDNPVQLAVERGKLFNVYSYVEHGANALFLLGELAINNIDHEGPILFWVSLWGIAYLAFAVGVFFISGRWLYPMLDVTKPISPFFYLSVYASIRFCFSINKPIKRYIVHMLSLRRETSIKQSNVVKKGE